MRTHLRSREVEESLSEVDYLRLSNRALSVTVREQAKIIRNLTKSDMDIQIADTRNKRNSGRETDYTSQQSESIPIKKKLDRRSFRTLQHDLQRKWEKKKNQRAGVDSGGKLR